uniref:Annexin n=1 Tax=Rhabditophanes sp. KR3021 TaxID=114890 RepID=A0AC35TSD0_9BILA
MSVHHMRPSVRAFVPFNADQDSETLRNAFEGKGCDSSAVMRVLTKRNNKQRQEIIQSYLNQYGRDLIKDLKAELKGDFEDVILALMVPKHVYDAQQLNKAMKGLGTNEDVLIEIACSRTNSELDEIKAAYEENYKKSLVNDVAGDTSGYFKTLLLDIFNANRPNCENDDRTKANLDARDLYRNGEQKWGTESTNFIKVLANRSYCQLELIFIEYEKITGHSFTQAIEKEFSGDLKKALLAIIKVVASTPSYFAERIHEAMKGFGCKDSQLIRVIVSRAEKDLHDIAISFEKEYGVGLIDMLTKECKGVYRECLIEIVRGN